MRRRGRIDREQKQKISGRVDGNIISRSRIEQNVNSFAFIRFVVVNQRANFDAEDSRRWQKKKKQEKQQ